MNDLERISKLTDSLNEAVKNRELEDMATKFEALELAYQEVFDDSIGGITQFIIWSKMQLAFLRYLTYGNFYGKAHQLAKDILLRIENILKESITDEQRKEIERVKRDVESIQRSLKPKHMNMTIPRLDSRCCLCRRNIANKTGSHMVPNFLSHPTFAVDDKGKRFREALNHTFLNGPEWAGSYYGPQAYERMEKVLGHIPTQEEIDRNINRLEYDNEFCADCEDRFGVLETAYAEFYNEKRKNLNPRISYLFWLSVIWRMSIGRMCLFLDSKDDLELRQIVDKGIVGKEKEIANSDIDLGNWHYALFRAEGLSNNGDKGILGSRQEKSPYVIMVNDLIVVFFDNVPTDEELTVGPIKVERDKLNSWKSQEVCTTVDRRFFWDVRDWIVESSYPFQDRPREDALKIIREHERHDDSIMCEEAKKIAIHTSRLAHPDLKVPLRIRKGERIMAAFIRQKEANEKGIEYDLFNDEDTFLCQRDFENYYQDLANLARNGYDVSAFPFYDEARRFIPNNADWKEKEVNQVKKGYEDTYDWFFNELLASEDIEDYANDKQDDNKWGRVGRNDPCPCGSGKKYKKCHGK